MKQGMKRIALLVVLMVSSSLALAQASKPAAPQEPPKAAAGQEAAKPSVKPAVVARKSRRSEDARRCLDKDSNTEIIKCAVEYL